MAAISAEPESAGNQRDETGDYKSISMAAVAALVLGLCSPAALANPLLMAVPAAAVGVALIALANIRRAGGTLAGERIARVGLAIGAFLIGVAVVRPPVRSALFLRQADAAAKSWVQLLAAGDFEAAEAALSGEGKQMLMPQRRPGSAAIPDDVVAATIRTGLTNHQLTREVEGRQESLTLTPTGEDMTPVIEGPVTRLTRYYVLEGAKSNPAYLQINMRRVMGVPGLSSTWHIDRWVIDSKPFSPPLN
jgi:hypothetical protein